VIYGFAVTFSDETTSPVPVEASSAEEAWQKLAIELVNDMADGYFAPEVRVEAIELQDIGSSARRSA